MSDLIGRDGVWSKLPKHVSNAVRKYCIDHNFVGDDGHISYVYGECALAAISAQPQSPTPEAQPISEAFDPENIETLTCDSYLGRMVHGNPGEYVRASDYYYLLRLYRAQSTPPEQRASEVIAAQSLPYDKDVDYPCDPNFTQAQPEAVRMPIAECMDCGRPYPHGLDMVLTKKQWLLINPDDGGLLCPSCMVNRAAVLEGAISVHAVIILNDAESDYINFIRLENSDYSRTNAELRRELQTERAAHERTRAELERMKHRVEQRDKQIAVYDNRGFGDADALAEKYLELEAELESLRAERK